MVRSGALYIIDFYDYIIFRADELIASGEIAPVAGFFATAPVELMIHDAGVAVFDL